MRIGNIEIRRVAAQSRIEDRGSRILIKAVDLANAFAVPDTEKWWQALHQVIDVAEMDANKGAQQAAGVNNEMCAFSAAGAQHISILRDRFIELRSEGLRGRVPATAGRQGSGVQDSV